MDYSVSFPTGNVRYIGAALPDMPVPAAECIAITDSHIAALYGDMLHTFNKTIVIPAGEEHKSWESIQSIVDQLLAAQAHKHTVIVGIGGGMLTDLAGFAAGIYMRGVRLGLMPTSLLAMVDAAIGGKNGINYGMQKNLLGTIRQPEFILFDKAFLTTLPRAEWQNGFAEIIKYACLFDEALFDELAQHDLDHYMEDEKSLWNVIAKCVAYKNKIVQADETDSNARKLLNFGHTAGHAIEKLYNLPHGQAVAVGMIIATGLSERTNALDKTISTDLKDLLHRYELPVTMNIDINEVMQVLRMDKKRNRDTVDYIILNKKGAGAIKPVSFDTIEEALTTFAHAGNH